MTGLDIHFRENKQKRKANWLLRRFASERALVVPETPEKHMNLFRQRGLGRQYRSGDGKVFFPTDAGWEAFRHFVDTMYVAEPFFSKATRNDVHQAYLTAFADMIASGVLPDCYDELSEYLPRAFVDSFGPRGEAIFHKLNGVNVKGDVFLRVGETWVGTFGNLSFEELSGVKDEYRLETIKALRSSFSDETAVISGGMIYATSDRTKREDSYRCEIALGVLDLMFNMSYLNSFGRLWAIRRVERPEQGVEKQFSFGFLRRNQVKGPELTLSTRFTEQVFELDIRLTERWHDSLLLSEINRIAALERDARTELQNKLLNAIIYFHQAAHQSTPETQISMLWVCVESVLTIGSERVLETNIPSLVAVTAWSLHKDFWPSEVENREQLEAILKKYYRGRSRTFHHGSIGHVTHSEVQEFSIVVSNLLVALAHLGALGYGTTSSVRESSQRYLQQMDSE
mgnify:CR=1 FL=1